MAYFPSQRLVLPSILTFTGKLGVTFIVWDELADALAVHIFHANTVHVMVLVPEGIDEDVYVGLVPTTLSLIDHW